eukprot:GHVQ01042707.1.p1 GENE.GHVQ01042707.1~~GHVQ01042707.1.p1  ORF type:complete len:357 (+),score=36.41 GHVQ01042707.1:540-1610(+)
MQSLADENNHKEFYACLKKVYGMQQVSLQPLWGRDKDVRHSTTCDILNRFKEHFNSILNQVRHVAGDVFRNIKQRSARTDMATTPTQTEVRKAIEKVKNGQAAGPDNLPAEFLKKGGAPVERELTSLIQTIWEQEQVPQDWRNGVVIPILKKGAKDRCDNYRGITLLSAAAKVFSTILLSRLQPLVAALLSEDQCGYRENRSTIDMIFVLRQLLEKSREKQQPLYVVFVDLIKAFDTVKRQALWKLLRKLGVPPKVVNLITQLHTNNQVEVRVGQHTSDTFEVSTGVRQGCMLAATLFIVYLDAAFREKEPNPPPGVRLTYSVYNFGLRACMESHGRRQEADNSGKTEIRGQHGGR